MCFFSSNKGLVSVFVFAGSITDTGRLVSTISDQNAGKSVVLYSLGFGNDVDFEVCGEKKALGDALEDGFSRRIGEYSELIKVSSSLLVVF